MNAPRDRLRCMIVFGTRPEVIKIAPVALAMRASPGLFDCRLIFTGQQRELGQQAMDMFGLTADIDLDLMLPNQTLGQFFSRAIADIDRVIVEEMPDWVIVQGDTGTVLVAALSAFYRQVPIAHIEAGLRTHDLAAPHPEEGNRQMVSRIASLHFPPTERSRKHLLDEGIHDNKIEVIGNTSIDAVHWMRDAMKARGETMPEAYKPNAGAERLVLTTLHRRESFGEPLTGMLEAIRDLSRDKNLGLTFLMPIHPNPQVSGPVNKVLGHEENIKLVPPLDYKTILSVMAQSWLVLTDSGGLQEEAPCFSVPVFVLRDVSDRPESIEAGIARLVGTGKTAIIDAVTALAHDPVDYARMRADINPYGDGQAAKLILRRLLKESGVPHA